MTTAPDSSLKEQGYGGRTWPLPPWAGPVLQHAGPQDPFWGSWDHLQNPDAIPFLSPRLLQWGTRPQASSSLSLMDNSSWRKCAEGLWGWRPTPSFALKALSHAEPADGHMGGASAGLMGTRPGPPRSVQGPRQACSSGFWCSESHLFCAFHPPRPLRAQAPHFVSSPRLLVWKGQTPPCDRALHCRHETGGGEGEDRDLLGWFDPLLPV